MKIVAALAALASTALIATLSAAARPEATKTINVSLTEMKFTLSPKTVKAGTTVIFKLKNVGAVPHDMFIKGSSVSAKSPKLAAGRTGTLRVTFKKAGSYPYICTLPGHKAAGMAGTFRAT